MKRKAKCNPFLFMLILIPLCADVGACAQSGVRVVVSNDGAKPISNVELVFTGGKESLQGLAGGMSHELRINPDGESGIILTFRHSDGTVRNEKLDVYLEKNYEGMLEVHITSDGTVKLKVMSLPRPRSFGIF